MFGISWKSSFNGLGGNLYFILRGFRRFEVYICYDVRSRGVDRVRGLGLVI